MAYRFKLDDLGAKGFRRIAREQIERAVTELGREGMAAASVHETRKVVKRLKSLLRLMRPALSEKTFRSRYRRISKIGDALAEMREMHVLSETIGKLETRFGPDGVAVLRPLRPLLVASSDETTGQADPAKIQGALAMAIIESRKLEKITLKAKGFEAASEGIEDTYRGARRNFKRAYRRPTADTFHDLRKCVQWHWRQMALISRAWPDYFQVRVAAARELAQILGDDHDLAVLHAEVKKLSPRLPEDAGAIEHLIRLRQEELRQAAQPFAERLFAEKPEVFVRRIGVYWTSAQTMRQIETGAKLCGEPVNPSSAIKAVEPQRAPRGEITQPVPVASPRLIR